MNGMSFGPHSFSDLDFADDVPLLAELLELLVPALEMMASEAASLRLEVNWQKTKVQALGSREDEPSTIIVQGPEVAVVENLSILALLTLSWYLTSQCHHLYGTQNLNSHIWKSTISISIKLKWYDTYILPIFLYDSLSAGQFPLPTHNKIDALDQQCLRIKWCYHVQNDVI